MYGVMSDEYVIVSIIYVISKRKKNKEIELKKISADQMVLEVKNSK